ncbi:MAG: hypothetical protein GWO26_31490 [Phycisphaerae bacterium]|nr:hypothetical protein [Phycisphaerae bacterium]
MVTWGDTVYRGTATQMSINTTNDWYEETTSGSTAKSYLSGRGYTTATVHFDLDNTELNVPNQLFDKDWRVQEVKKFVGDCDPDSLREIYAQLREIYEGGAVEKTDLIDTDEVNEMSDRSVYILYAVNRETGDVWQTEPYSGVYDMEDALNHALLVHGEAIKAALGSENIKTWLGVLGHYESVE